MEVPQRLHRTTRSLDRLFCPISRFHFNRWMIAVTVCSEMRYERSNPARPCREAFTDLGRGFPAPHPGPAARTVRNDATVLLRALPPVRLPLRGCRTSAASCSTSANSSSST